MALVGFPNQIEVVAGASWTAGITPDETLVLTKIGETDQWSDGTKLIFSPQFISGATMYARGLRPTINTTQLFQVSNSDVNTNYDFLDLWASIGFGTQVNIDFLSSSATYNPGIFSLMREYAPPASGNPHYAYAQQQ